MTISESDIQDDETISDHEAISVEEQLLQESNELSLATHSDSEPVLRSPTHTHVVSAIGKNTDPI